MRVIDADILLQNFDDMEPYEEYESEHALWLDMRMEVINAPILTPPNEPLTLEFDVIDKTTSKYPDWEKIAIEESWANGLIYCDMDGIAIREDGTLILLDECGNCVSCSPDRFEICRRS